jgi:hypothetical protein
MLKYIHTYRTGIGAPSGFTDFGFNSDTSDELMSFDGKWICVFAYIHIYTHIYIYIYVYVCIYEIVIYMYMNVSNMSMYS